MNVHEPDQPTLDEGEALVEALEILLEREARVLRAADFAALPELLVEKERLAAALGEAPSPADAGTIRRLQASAQRNAMLLAAAGEGLRSAAEGIRALTAPTPPLHTYDGAGRRAPIAPGRPGTERRA